MSGVSFASAGSGFDPLTPALSVFYISLSLSLFLISFNILSCADSETLNIYTCKHIYVSDNITIKIISQRNTNEYCSFYIYS